MHLRRYRVSNRTKGYAPPLLADEAEPDESGRVKYAVSSDGASPRPPEQPACTTSFWQLSFRSATGPAHC
jgi:hypothetical protein